MKIISLLMEIILKNKRKKGKVHANDNENEMSLKKKLSQLKNLR